MALQPCGNLCGGRAVPLHPQRQGLEAAQRQERIERPLDAAHGILQIGQPLAQLLVRADNRDTAHHVGMPVEILGGRVHHQVEAVFERVLHVGTGEGVVGRGQKPAPPRDHGDTFEIDQLEQRIGRRLDPDQPGIRADRRLDRIRIGQVQAGGFEPHRAVAHPLEQAPRAAIEIVDRDDVRAVVETFQRGRDRREPRRECKRLGAAFEVGDAAFERHPGRVLRAGIFVALVHAGARLHVGRGGVDRHHHRAGGRIGRLPGMNAAGGEIEPVRRVHRAILK